ncbi:hypothetical protein [Nocardia sp. NPDC051750]|uniref:hypothetical protein n=1 Tax=Nocardia sp. NPDC051750 TaxID=3364325 RepID=UPI0037A395BB
MNKREEPMLDPSGDIGVSRVLSQALKVLADNTVDKNLEKQLREIRNGTGSLRDLEASESFLRLGDSVLEQVRQDQANRTDEEKQQLVDSGNAILERYRREDPHTADHEAPVAPQAHPALERPVEPVPPHNPAPRPASNPRQSWRDVVVTPDEPDEDDLYFQERRQRGWLQ